MYQGKFRNKDRQMPELNQELPDEDEVYIEDEYIPDVELPEAPPKKEKKKHRGPRITGVIFYLLFFGAIAFAVLWGRQQTELLGRELDIYEQAQPGYRCQEIYDSLFADPDWGKFYTDSGCQDTAFENVDTYAAYMKDKTSGKELTWSRVACDEANTWKFGVWADQEPVASFTMVNTAPNADVPDWQAGEVELILPQRQQELWISMPYGCVASLNGVILDDSYIVETDAITVTGQDGSRMELNKSCRLHADGFLLMPDVTVTAADGTPLEVQYDEASRTFSVPLAETEAISQEHQELALEAVKTYCLYMVNKAGAGDLSRYFKRGTDTFGYITGSDLVWVQKDSGADFGDPRVTNSAMFGENMFAARVSLTFQLKRSDGSLKESKVDESLFFEKQDGGAWLCTQMTAVDIFSRQQQVRLTFRNGEEILSDSLVSAAEVQIPCPEISVPEGKTFAGWAAEATQADGTTVLQLVFFPGETGTSPVPAGMELKPMVLQPVFTDPV